MDASTARNGASVAGGVVVWGVTEVARVPATAIGRLARGGRSIFAEAREVAGLSPPDGSRPATGDEIYAAWYAGLALMAALRVIEWRLAAVTAAVHAVERNAHRRRVQEFAEGLGAGV